MKKEDIIKEAVNIIKKYLTGNYKILLFGSWVRGDALETSDIDIGILGDEEVPWNIMAKILSEKENIYTLRAIDIVDLRAKNEKFSENVLKYGKVLAQDERTV